MAGNREHPTTITRRAPTTTTTLPLVLQLLLLLLLPLSCTAGQAYRPLSYHDRVLASVAAFRHAHQRSQAVVPAHLQADTLSPDSVHVNSFSSSSGQDTLDGSLQEVQDFVGRLWSLPPDSLRQALLDSLTSLSQNAPGAAGGSSSTRPQDGVGSDPGSEAGPGSASGSVQEQGPLEYETCVNDTTAFVLAVVEGQHWAMQMLDAMGKPSPGITEGNLLWPGAYTMCGKIRSNSSAAMQPDFHGVYANAYMSLKTSGMPFSMGAPVVMLGLCVPSTCSKEDMTWIINDVLARLNFTMVPGVGLDYHIKNNTLDTKATVAVVICSLLLFLLALGTAVDVLLVQMPRWRVDSATYVSANGHSKGEEHLPLISKTTKSTGGGLSDLGTGYKVLLAFSVYTNGSKLLSTKQAPGSLTCIHGVRFLSMTWVVLGHGFLFPQGLQANLLEFFTTSINRWTFQTIANALVSVDSFFVLSGLLVSYLTLKEMKRNSGRLNWALFYFHRFWRLTPAYMLVIMVYVCISPYWGEGPFWANANADRDNCEDNWWTNLLYVNNFVKPGKMCLGQSWYLANDMQFYCILSPLVILPLYYAPLWGCVVAGSLVLGHCVSSAALTMHNNYPPGFYAQVKDAGPADLASWDIDFYIKPYTRMGPYVIGLLAGFFLYVKECKLDIKWYTNLALWALASGSATAVLYGLYGASSGSPITLEVSAFYNAVHRNVWGVCVSWVIIACVTGNGGFVNTLLSWPAFVPLSRLTYCIYLLHLMMMDLYLENSTTVFYFTDVNVVMFVLAILVVSYMAAVVASLAFEAPMMALERVMLRRDVKPSRDDTMTSHANGHSQSNGHGGKSNPLRPGHQNGHAPASK